MTPFVAGAILLIASSCSTVNRTVLAPPGVEGAAFVGDKVCLECHAPIARAFPGNPHARVSHPMEGLEDTIGCESCHGPASRHVASGGGRGLFIVNPRSEPATCFQCHLDVHAQFRLPQHHPVIEGRMNCVECHDPHGSDMMKPAGGLAMARLNESCAQCHRDQSRPFVFEHEALREGCTVCHQPHGSINDKLLVERDNNLCLKCHAQVHDPGTGEVFIGKQRHTQLLQQGGCWTAGCHPAVHGSNVQPRFRY
jgi:predicted CXXCH cytochrome family protein